MTQNFRTGSLTTTTETDLTHLTRSHYIPDFQAALAADRVRLAQNAPFPAPPSAAATQCCERLANDLVADLRVVLQDIRVARVTRHSVCDVLTREVQSYSEAGIVRSIQFDLIHATGDIRMFIGFNCNYNLAKTIPYAHF
jgi:hypothetical protein